MEAVALDGLEVLLKPLAKANPNAKDLYYKCQE